MLQRGNCSTRHAITAINHCQPWHSELKYTRQAIDNCSRSVGSVRTVQVDSNILLQYNFLQNHCY